MSWSFQVSSRITDHIYYDHRTLSNIMINIASSSIALLICELTRVIINFALFLISWKIEESFTRTSYCNHTSFLSSLYDPLFIFFSLQLVMIHYNLLNCDYDSLLSTGTGKKYNSPSSVTLVKAKHVEQNISSHGVLRVVCVTIFLNANEIKNF